MKTTEFPHRKIWRITYPVLISLLMEHLIGMTDTAFMGHVGEVELGASAIAGIYYMVLYCWDSASAWVPKSLWAAATARDNTAR